MPNAGSGSSGGTSSAGKVTSHDPPGYAYRQRFSFSEGQHVNKHCSGSKTQNQTVKSQL